MVTPAFVRRITASAYPSSRENWIRAVEQGTKEIEDYYSVLLYAIYRDMGRHFLFAKQTGLSLEVPRRITDSLAEVLSNLAEDSYLFGSWTAAAEWHSILASRRFVEEHRGKTCPIVPFAASFDEEITHPQARKSPFAEYGGKTATAITEYEVRKVLEKTPSSPADTWDVWRTSAANAEIAARKGRTVAVNYCTEWFDLGRYDELSSDPALLGWIFYTQGDGKVCPLCSIYDGTFIAKGSGVRAYPPLHDWCRCWIMPADEFAAKHSNRAEDIERVYPERPVPEGKGLPGKGTHVFTEEEYVRKLSDIERQWEVRVVEGHHIYVQRDPRWWVQSGIEKNYEAISEFLRDYRDVLPAFPNWPIYIPSRSGIMLGGETFGQVLQQTGEMTLWNSSNPRMSVHVARHEFGHSVHNLLMNRAAAGDPEAIRLLRNYADAAYAYDGVYPSGAPRDTSEFQPQYGVGNGGSSDYPSYSDYPLGDDFAETWANLDRYGGNIGNQSEPKLHQPNWEEFDRRGRGGGPSRRETMREIRRYLQVIA